MRLVHVRLEQNHMATTFDFRISCPVEAAGRAELALERAHSRMTALEVELSEFFASGPIHALNRAAPGQRVSMPRSAIELLQQSARMEEQTRGSFSCVAKSLPAPSAPGSWLPSAAGAARIGFERLSRSHSAYGDVYGEAWRLDAEVRVGFGAIGKGYALDEARLIVEEAGFNDYLLSAGGSSILISGFAGPGDPWTWGWTWANDAEGFPLGCRFTHSSGKPMAIGVSGTQEQGAHLIDPRSDRGSPRPYPKSSLVAHSSAMAADALSTALYVSGWDEAMAWTRSLHPSPAMALIDFQGVPCWNGHFRQLCGVPPGWRGAPLLRSEFRPAGEAGSAPPAASESALASPSRSRPILRLVPSTWALMLAFSLLALAAQAETAPSVAPAPALSASASASAPVADAPGAATSVPTANEGEASAAESIDLADLGGGQDSFTPYITERNPAWMILPASMIAFVLVHLRKVRQRARFRAKNSPPIQTMG